MMRTRALLLVIALSLSGCGSGPTGTASNRSTAGATSDPLATPASTPQSIAGAGSCDSIADAVHRLVPGTTGHTDKVVGGFTLCKWDSTQPTSVGMHAFFQATVSDASFFQGTAKGIGQSTSYMQEVKKFSPGGFDQATGFWNEPTHTFELLVLQGDHSALLEASTSRKPSVDSVVAIAHALVG